MSVVHECRVQPNPKNPQKRRRKKSRVFWRACCSWPTHACCLLSLPRCPADGYKLGEHCDWFKHDNYEDSTRIPLLLKPARSSLLRLGGRAGREVAQLVEEVDIFPSLLDLAGLSVPEELQGESWVPLLTASGSSSAGKAAVFSQYPHSSKARNHLTMGYFSFGDLSLNSTAALAMMVGVP